MRLDPEHIFLVQLSDNMWQKIQSVKEQAATATHFRVFQAKARTARTSRRSSKADAIGYRGNYSFDVYNDDYQQETAPETVVNRARRAAEWLVETVLRRALPVPNMERLQRTARDRDALTAIKPLAEKSQKV
jgi:hypothetical protein